MTLPTICHLRLQGRLAGVSAEFPSRIPLSSGPGWHFAEYSPDIPLPGSRMVHLAESLSDIPLSDTLDGHSADSRIPFPPPYYVGA